MLYYSMFDTLTFDAAMLTKAKALSIAGNMVPIELLGGKWTLCSGLRWPGSLKAPNRQVAETDEEYIVRIKPIILGYFDSGLPGGLTLTDYQFQLLKNEPEWKALEPVIEQPTT